MIIKKYHDAVFVQSDINFIRGNENRNLIDKESY